jgi:ABC-type antimicrobial peptide transport system permease subunit
VQQRTQEIGIRLALGAEAHRVRNMVVAHGMRLAIVGVLIGIVSAFALARVMAGLIYGVTTTDPLVFAVTPMVLIVVAFAGVWLPARRAARVDPVIALRAE